MNGLVRFKPMLGLVSRTHIVPISHSQHTPGPMAKPVRDAAAMLGAMVATDLADPATAGADARRRDYVAGLSASALSGLRVAVYRRETMSPDLSAHCDVALGVLRGAGAVLVDVKRPELDGLGKAKPTVLLTELKIDLDGYLATTRPGVTARTLDQVIAFNKANAATEMPFSGRSCSSKR